MIEDMIKTRRNEIAEYKALAEEEPYDDFAQFALSRVTLAEKDIELLEKILRMADEKRGRMV